MRVIQLLIAVLFFGLASTFAATYYVDASAGNDSNAGTSPSTAWKSMSKVNSFSFQPGDFILFSRGGTWNQTLIPKSSGTSSAPITFGAYGSGSLPVIDLQQSSTAGVAISDKSYIIVENFYITNVKLVTTFSGGVTLLRTNYCTVRNCTINSTGRAGVFLEGQLTSPVAGMGNLIQNNTITVPTGTSSNTEQDVIFEQRSTNNIIDGNTLINNSISVLDAAHNDVVQSYSDNGLTIKNNYAEQNSPRPQNQCLYVESSTGTINYFNNVCKGQVIESSLLKWAPTSGNANIISNTIYNGASNPVQIYNSNFVFKNNVVIVTNSGACVSLTGGNPSTGNMTNNLYKNSSTGSSVISSSGSYTLAQWKAKGFDANSIEADPVFTSVSSKDFSLQSTSPAIDKGYTLSSPYNVDRLGNQRPSGNGFDMGAYERISSNVVSIPSVPVLSSPSSGATNQATALTLSWGSVSGATSYTVQVATDNAFSNLIINDASVTTNSKSISSLANSTTYYWRVLATNSAGSSSYSSAFSFTTIAAIPSVPTLASPSNGATNQATALTLSWGSVSGATSYTIQVATDNTFSNLIVNDAAVTTNSKAISGLANSTAYYWRVLATNSAGSSSYSSAFSFTTIAAIPSVPTLASPSNGATNQATALTLSWGSVSGATSYTVQVATDNAFSNLIVNDAAVTTNSKAISGLANSTTYYWRVLAKNSAGSSSYSSAFSFTTTAPAVVIPSVPTLASPSNGATNQATALTLSWGSVSGATSYTVQVATDNAFSNLIVNDAAVTTNSKAISGLANSTAYYWRVLAKNSAGSSSYSSTFSFTTTAPAVVIPSVPTLASPSNGATNQATSLTLSWGSVSGATGYTVQVATDNAFSNLIINDAAVTTNSKAISGLANSTTYYWRVLAKNSAGSSSYSSTFSFTTTAPAVVIPSVPTLASPSNGATNQATALTLSWGSVSGATSYTVQVATDNAFSNLIVNDAAVTTNSKAISGLANSTAYYWRVLATNSAGSSSFSSIFSFTTMAAAITTTSKTYYIDPSGNDANDGKTPATAWATISKINSSTFAPGDSILFKTDGCWAGYTLVMPSSGTAAAPIVISSYGTGSMPLIDGDYKVAKGIDIQNKKYISIENIKFCCMLSADNTGAVNIVSSSYITVKNSNFSIEGRSGVYMNAAANCLIQNNIMSTPATDLGVQTLGISSSNGTANTFDGNSIVISNKNTTYASDCISTYKDNADVVKNNYVEQNNTRTSGQGIFVSTSTGGTTLIFNNVCYGMYTSASLIKYKYATSGSSVIVSNTIYGGKSDLVQTDDPKVIFRNNIIQTTGAYTLVYFINAVNTANINNNIYKRSTTGTSVIDYGTRGNKTLKQWQSLGFDKSSFEADPKFTSVSTKNFSILATSPAIDKGYALGAPYNTDKRNVSRPTGAGYDIGAFEYTTQLLNGKTMANNNNSPVENDELYKVETSENVPQQYELGQNYPNPFNPSTTIRYTLPQNSMVTLKVYDILGKEVATLVNETKAAGSYEINFNALNLASGTYIYRIQADGFTQTRKMVLMK